MRYILLDQRNLTKHIGIVLGVALASCIASSCGHNWDTTPIVDDYIYDYSWRIIRKVPHSPGDKMIPSVVCRYVVKNGYILAERFPIVDGRRSGEAEFWMIQIDRDDLLGPYSDEEFMQICEQLKIPADALVDSQVTCD